jgi:hypothetical protein
MIQKTAHTFDARPQNFLQINLAISSDERENDFDCKLLI